jgi:hypothetical protein
MPEISTAPDATMSGPRPGRTTSVARWVSILAHPFVTALVLVGTVELRDGPVAAARGMGVVALLLVLPVAVLMVRQVRRGRWDNVDASNTRERPVLYGVGALGLVALLAYLTVAYPGSALLHGAVGTLAMIAVCAVATPWIKVSLHMAVAALAATVLLYQRSPVGWLLAALLPCLAWSRVRLGRHRWPEVALGGAIGAIAGMMIVRYG